MWTFLRLQGVSGSTQRIWGWRGGCLEESPWVMLICKTDHKKRGPSWEAKGVKSENLMGGRQGV